MFYVCTYLYWKSNIWPSRRRAASATTCITYIRRMACIYMTYVLCMYIYILKKQHLTIKTASCISHYVCNICTSYGMYIHDICFMYVHTYIEKATSRRRGASATLCVTYTWIIHLCNIRQPRRRAAAATICMTYIWLMAWIYMTCVMHVYIWHMLCMYMNTVKKQYQTVKMANCMSYYMWNIYMTYGMDTHDVCYGYTRI